MLTIALATAALIALAPAPLPVGMDTDRVAAAREASTDPLENARRLVSEGAFDAARREFLVAIVLDRDAGRVPTEASLAFSHMLFAQSREREAATVLEGLAADAWRLRSPDCEARALMDLAWLNVRAGRNTDARADVLRLRELMRNPDVSVKTRSEINKRFRF
ncbi:MAG TPA: hypothetical protein VE869_00875 [Gemmatimonas sp.]|nr:hypothetical protein [Gemmatimonas sp.]